MIPSRMTRGKAMSESWVAEKAVSAALKAVAHSTAAGMASTAHGEVTPPSAAAATRKATAEMAVRTATHAR